VGSTLFFTANDVNGNELWKLNEAGIPVLVKDILAGAGSAYPTSLYNVNGTLYFTANDGVHGAELWKSDGTAAGTVLAKDINGRTYSSDPNSLIDVAGILYFVANNGVDGQELWKINPATGIPVKLEINVGANGFAISYLTNINGTLYFQASDDVNGYELWKIGSTGNPELINLGTGSSSPSNLTNVNGVLYFRANSEYSGDTIVGYGQLWKINGSGQPEVVQVGAIGNYAYVDKLTLVGSTL
jgi:ELWxxDGT repeat protein